MKLTVMFICLFTFTAHATVFSQSTTVNLNLKEVSLKEALKTIEKQTQCRFFYNDAVIDLSTKVSLSANNETVENVLTSLLRSSNVNFKVLDDNFIVITPVNLTTQQKITISGTVLDSKTNESLPGVNVKIKGTQNGTSTDAQGRFKLDVADGSATLVFSFMGYTTQEVKLSGKVNLSVSLVQLINNLDEVVVVGYQQVNKKTNSASVVSIRGKDLENVPVASFDQMLQGRLPGVNIQNFTGEPGAKTSFVVRGNTNLMRSGDFSSGQGYSDPLYVIDGVPYSSSDLNLSDNTGTNFLAGLSPNEIESIDILKDASAAAIYGSRGANGVVIIKTKTGKDGKTQVFINSYMGFTQRPGIVNVLTGAEERRMKWKVYNTYAPSDKVGGVSDIPMILTDSLSPDFNNNTNWQDYFYTTGIVKNVDAAVAGGNEKMNYRLSAGMYNEDGIIRQTGFDRYSMGANVNVNISKRIDLQSYIRFSKTNRKTGRDEGLSNMLPISPSDMPSSLIKLTDDWKDYLLGEYDQIRNVKENNAINLSTTLGYKIFPWLKYEVHGVVSYENNLNQKAVPSTVTKNYATAYTAYGQNKHYEFENFLRYDKRFSSGHNIQALLATSFVKNTGEGLYTGSTKQANDYIKVVDPVTREDGYGASYSETNTMSSVFGNIIYNFKEKYLFSANFRADGSSRFGPDSRWGYFPSISTGWVFSEEKFMKPLSSVVTWAKVRASWGINGNQFPDNYLYLNTYKTGGADFGYAPNISVNTYNGLGVAYPNYVKGVAQKGLTWEQTEQWSAALEFELWKGRVFATVEGYKRNTDNLLFDIDLPTTTGYESIKTNAAGVRNTGFEIMITTRNLSEKSPLKWSTSFNLARNWNIVTKLPYGNRDFKVDGYRAFTVGKSMNQYYLWYTDGVYMTQADIPVNPFTGVRGASPWGTIKPGWSILRDVNGDYQEVEGDDVVAIDGKDPNPKYVGGITNTFQYKGFTLSFLFTYTLGRDIFNSATADKLYSYAFSGEKGFATSGMPDLFKTYDMWEPGKTSAKYPEISPFVGGYRLRSFQTLYLEDGSYLKLKSINFSYDIRGNKLLKNLGVQSLKAFVMAENVAIFQNCTMPDAERVGADGRDISGGYPLARKFTIGLNLSF